MTINRLNYPSTHPSKLILQPKTIFIPSLKTKPFKKKTITKYIKPPKLFTNRWFFQEELSKQPLLMLLGTAIDFNSPYLSVNTNNNCIEIKILNPEIFNSTGFDLTTYNTLKYLYYSKTNGSTKKMIKIKDLDYNTTNYFFSPYLQNTTQVYTNKDNTKYNSDTTYTDTDISTTWLPVDLIKELKYQPNRDTGKDNVVFLEYTTTQKINVPSNESYKLENLPLWLLFWGFADYMSKLHYTNNIYTSTNICFKSKFVYGTDFIYNNTKPVLFVNNNFIRSKNNYNSPPTLHKKNM